MKIISIILFILLSLSAIPALSWSSQPQDITKKSKVILKSPDEPSAEAKASVVQAFAYIGSARGSANAVAQAELLANAEKELSKAIKIYPNYAEAILNRGVVYMAMHKLNKAEVDLDLAKKLDPNNANVHYNLVCLYAKTKRFDLAIDSLDSALSLGFDDYDTLRSDVDLKVLRKTKEFVKTCEKHKVFIK